MVDQMCEIGKPEPLNEEAGGMAENYHDEVSIRVGGNAQPSKVLNKKKCRSCWTSWRTKEQSKL